MRGRGRGSYLRKRCKTKEESVHPAFREQFMRDRQREIAEAVRFAQYQPPKPEPSPRQSRRLTWIARRRVRHAC